MKKRKNRGPLAGIKVLDLSKYGPSRYCSMILADLGAEVIVVEMPKTAGQTLDVVSEDIGSLYIGHNRNKKFIVLNIKKEEGKEIFYRLAEKMDVVIDHPHQRIIAEDARTFLNRNRETYDAILSDTFNSHYAIPFHLATQEAAQRMKDALSPNGVVLVNLLSHPDGECGRFFHALLAPMLRYFPGCRPLPWETSTIVHAGKTSSWLPLPRRRRSPRPARTRTFPPCWPSGSIPPRLRGFRS